MRGSVVYGPRDARLKWREVPTFVHPRDPIAATPRVLDSWPDRGMNPIAQPTPMGHGT
jgi:hypothetical protein